MSLPTLMLKGKLRPPTDDPILKKELDEWVPIEYVLNWFRARLDKTGVENRVLVLKSETASGKSTMFPPELFKAFVREKVGEAAPGIICTQPRVMTAIENVMEILKHYSKILRLGETIGWSTKANKLRPTSTSLLSATIGTLAQQLKVFTDEEIIERYRFILIDETHERSQETDMTLYMLKNLLLRNRDNVNCPFVVLMSATFDPQSFLTYYNVSIQTNFIWCVGETAGFDEMWDWNDGRTIGNYPQAAASVVEKIVTDNPNDDPAKADILIFMPGQSEFTAVVAWLEKLNKKLAIEGKSVFSILQIERMAVQTRNLDFMRTIYIPVTEHEIKIGDKIYTPNRRVIVTTNVAETGLTLDNLKYVIDAGYNREVEYNPVLGIRGLITKPAPKSRIRQRRGRAGRKFRGVFYPLYPKYIYEKMPDLQFPQILIEDVTPIMINIINEQLKVKKLAGDANPEFSIGDIDMIDVPTPDALASSLEKLYLLGFISPKGESGKFGLTGLGNLANNFSMIPMESIRMIFSAYFWGCSVLDVITVAAYLSIGARSFSTPPTKGPTGNIVKNNISWMPVYKSGLPTFIYSNEGSLYRIRLLIADDFIHGIILFNAIKRIMRRSSPADSILDLQIWCDQNYISLSTCLDFVRARDDIIDQMLTAGMEIFTQEDDALLNATEDNFMDIITRIKYCIYDGYRNNILLRDGVTYHTLNGLTVLPPKLFREDERKLAEKSEYGIAVTVLPTMFVYNELSLKYNAKVGMYDIAVDRVSVLDGFISPDFDFAI